MIEGWGFNPPPNWPKPPGDWTPPRGWRPDPIWGPVPPGWQLWVPVRRVSRRRALLPITGLGAMLALITAGALVPRAAGPGAGDPRTGGAAIISSRLPSATATPAAPQPSPSGTATDDPTPSAAVIRAFASCAELNVVYPNGVGLPEAVDQTDGRPVTSFGRSTTIYHMNLKYDADGDGIACEPGG